MLNGNVNWFCDLVIWVNIGSGNVESLSVRSVVFLELFHKIPQPSISRLV